MRWPPAWKDPAALDLLRDSPIDTLLIESGAVADEAKRRRLTVIAKPPQDVTVIKGEWPGVRIDANGGTSAGPTGAPWIDSNGWRVRLERARNPGREVCVDAPPKGPRLSVDAYAMAFLDAAVFGARWIVTLDDAGEAWPRIKAAARLFGAHPDWRSYAPKAVVGVLSDFTGENEFMGTEVLNLLARANQQYRVIPRSRPEFAGLRAILYVDAQSPPRDLRLRLESFVTAGGLLMAGPKWGPAGVHTMGKGRIAVSRKPPEDPWVLANDSILQVSHRHDLVRFFNVGAVNSFLTGDDNRSLLHLLFYTDKGPQDLSVWLAGRYRAAKLWTPVETAARTLEPRTVRDGIELHLPPLGQYAAIELEV